MSLAFSETPKSGFLAWRPNLQTRRKRADHDFDYYNNVYVICYISSPQYVRERLLCHAIIGRQGGKELIMKIDVTTDFISPLLEFSTKSVYFRVDKVYLCLLLLYTPNVPSDQFCLFV